MVVQTVLALCVKVLKDTVFCRGHGGCLSGDTGQCGWDSCRG